MGAIYQVQYKVYASQVATLKEIKQVQLQILELQASLKTDGQRQVLTPGHCSPPPFTDRYSRFTVHDSASCILPPHASLPLACEFNLRVRTASSLPIKMLPGAHRMNAAAHRFARQFLLLPLVFMVFAILFALGAHAAPVLMISIDGLKPEYITQADAHGMKIPYLRTLLVNGTYADGVVGIWPTVTYPSHTTLITGVWPAEHGIYNNHEFDPFQRYFETRGTGMLHRFACPRCGRPRTKPACVQPASDGPSALARRTWTTSSPNTGAAPKHQAHTNSVDQLLMAALARPATLIQELEPAAGPYMNGNVTTPRRRRNQDPLHSRNSAAIQAGIHDAAPELA